MGTDPSGYRSPKTVAENGHPNLVRFSFLNSCKNIQKYMQLILCDSCFPFFKLKEVNNAVPEPNMTAVPWMLGRHTSATATSHAGEMILCSTCITNGSDPQGSSSKPSQNRVSPFLKSADGRSLTLRYRSEDEGRVVREIVATGSSRVKDRPPLTAAFLLCLCLQYSSICLHTSDMRRLLLLIASGVQSAMWVSRGEKQHCLLIVRYASKQAVI